MFSLEPPFPYKVMSKTYKIKILLEWSNFFGYWSWAIFCIWWEIAIIIIDYMRDRDKQFGTSFTLQFFSTETYWFNFMLDFTLVYWFLDLLDTPKMISFIFICNKCWFCCGVIFLYWINSKEVFNHATHLSFIL